MDFAKSLSGHDKNQYYLVLRKEADCLFLVNGTNRSLEKPKKKKEVKKEKAEKMAMKTSILFPFGRTIGRKWSIVQHKFKEQTERIKNPSSYMLTLLYNSKEQMNLDISNQVQHDMYHWKNPTEE